MCPGRSRVLCRAGVWYRRWARGWLGARVLVCAPAGSGKTALLADWARRGGRPVAWLGLDGGDNDPARFWRYALDRARPGLAGRVGPLPPRSFEGLVTALINELAWCAGIWRITPCPATSRQWRPSATR